MKKRYLLLIAFLCFGHFSFAQSTYYSKATATNFNAVASWGTATDGTGIAPSSISNADNFIISNGAIMALSANANVRALTLDTGRLLVATHNLTVEIAGQNNTVLSALKGILEITTGTVIVNGAAYFTNGSGLIQSGGLFSIDGNSGTPTTSTGGATGTIPIFGIGYNANGNPIGAITDATNFQLTGGILRIVDPPISTSRSAIAFGYRGITGSTAVHVNAGINHTVEFGDAVSTDFGGTDSGFVINPYVITGGGGRFYFGNLKVNTVSATNRLVSNVNSFGIGGNLEIITGGELAIISGLFIGGNIINNGTLTTVPTLIVPSPAISFQNLISGATSAVATLQTVSGGGVFRNHPTSPTANFNNIVFHNSITGTAGIVFSAANTMLSGSNTGTVSGNITFTAGRVSTSGFPFVLGTSISAPGSISHSSGGFVTGSIFGRWYSASNNGTTITASTLPTISNTSGSYPFVNGFSLRSFFIQRPTTTSATGGVLNVAYTEGTGGFTTISTVPDGAYSINRQSTANWAITATNGFAAGTGTFNYAASGTGIYTMATGSTRVMKVATVVGNHQYGTNTPHGQRTAISATNFLGTFYLGVDVADFPILSATNGPWEATSTWVGGVVPTCLANALILSPHTITVNAATINVKNVTVNVGGSLIVSGNTFTVGCTNNNSTLTNNGTLNITAGTINVNGNFFNASGSIFSQTGGTININGNNGVAATSVPSGIPLFALGTSGVTLSGGSINIINPHAGTGNETAFSYLPSTNVNASVGHTLQFGDGVSSIAGGSATGFRITPGAKIMFGNIIMNTLASANAVHTQSSQYGILGNLTITSGDFQIASGNTVHVNGNLINNATLTTIGTLSFANFTNNTPIASTNAQTVSGTGIFRNAVVTPTANAARVTFNNDNATGLTLNVPIAVSNALTHTKGIINTTAINILTIADGCTLTATASTSTFVNGPVKKIGNDNIVFPLGKTGTPNRVGECGIDNTAGTNTDEFTAEYFANPYSNLAVALGVLTAIDSAEYWNINRNVGSSTPNITLYWKDGVFTGIPGIISSANITVAHYNSGTSLWNDQVYFSHTGSRLLGGSVTTNAVNNFSPFTIGLITGVLPLTINSFAAFKQNSNTNAINWKANCTRANISFELQRSTNGIVFVPINSLTATQARCAAPFTYTDNYNATSPITYYRLKCINYNTNLINYNGLQPVEINGLQPVYSQIIAINNKNTVAHTIALYPNIVKDNAILVVESNTTSKVNFLITDAKGAIIRSFTENLSEGANAYPINVSKLSAGNYQISGIVNGILKTLRFIKQ